MTGSFLLAGGDTRSYWAARHLMDRGAEVSTSGVPGMPDTVFSNSIEYFVLPFPSFRGALLRGASAIPVEELLCRVKEGSQVFGGQFGPWREEFEKRGAQVCELYGSEPLTTANAVSTAEGAIALAMDHSPITLHGARCLVVGYGRVGKVLAQKLHALSAKVTVSLRKASDRALAEAFGLLTDESGVYLHGLSQFDFVFNTVAAQVFSPVQLAQFSKDCLLIELASLPGGMDKACCQELGLCCLEASGLPGKCAPKTAGILYANSILEWWEGKNGK